MTPRPAVRHLTDGSHRGGVYRVLGDPSEVAERLAGDGWAVGIADEVDRTRDFYRQVAHALAFPDYFGDNLDALWDALTDLQQPTVLVLTRWSTYARSRPERWQQILRVLAERAAIDPPFAVVLL